MTSTDKIRRLYNLPEYKNLGFLETDIFELEEKLNITLPLEIRNYYLTLGKAQEINFSHNRLLRPNDEIGFSTDGYLVFYEENQGVVYWGIKETDLILDNPPVWGNYGTDENPDWQIETNSADLFFLLMLFTTELLADWILMLIILGRYKQKRFYSLKKTGTQ